MATNQKPSLTLIPYGGLGNRLRVLNSAFGLGRDLGAEVELIWGALAPPPVWWALSCTSSFLSMSFRAS